MVAVSLSRGLAALSILLFGVRVSGDGVGISFAAMCGLLPELAADWWGFCCVGGDDDAPSNALATCSNCKAPASISTRRLREPVVRAGKEEAEEIHTEYWMDAYSLEITYTQTTVSGISYMGRQTDRQTDRAKRGFNGHVSLTQSDKE